MIYGFLSSTGWKLELIAPSYNDLTLVLQESDVKNSVLVVCHLGLLLYVVGGLQLKKSVFDYRQLKRTAINFVGYGSSS